MDLRDKIKRFKIEHIDRLSICNQFKILECFMEDGDRLLFHDYNTKLSEIKPKVLERLKNEFFEDYCEDTLYFHPGNKEILISNIIDVLSLCKNKYKCKDTVEELYSKLIIKDEEVVKWVEIDVIKLMIFEMFNFNNYSLGKKEWLENRIVFENKMYLDEYGMSRDDSSQIWYCPKNYEEVIRTMAKVELYSCIIINKNAEFSKYSYALKYYENAVDYDLLIFDNCDCFYKNVIPKLLKYDKEIINFIKEEK